MVPSSNIVVIPGFQAPHYPGAIGVPVFPAASAGLAGYNFSQLATGAVSTAALQGFDTVILYGLRWSDLSPSAQAAINTFALTGKVMIWDADSTGAQNYASFIHPFATAVSGEDQETHLGSAVTFPTGADPLASSDPLSPLYLDPSALTASNHLIEDMNAMNPGPPAWAPALIASNRMIPNGGWVLSWAYGSTANHTGMVIYSGMDADAFADPSSPNYALKELAIELAAPFAPSVSSGGCAPSCSAPPVAGAPPGTGGLGNPTAPTFIACSLRGKAPVSWLHGRIHLTLTTGVAAGIAATAVTAQGKVVGRGVTTTPGLVALSVDTRLLPSNRVSKIREVVYVNSAEACSVTTSLKVDNTPARFLVLKARHVGARSYLTLRTTEDVRLTLVNGNRTLRTLRVRHARTVRVALPNAVRTVTAVLTDRAGNRTLREVRW